MEKLSYHYLQQENEKLRKELKEAQELWQMAIESSKLGVWDWDMSTNEVFFSDIWKDMLGFKPDEISGSLEEWEKRVHPEDRVNVYRDINNHINGFTPIYVNEHRVLCKDGSYKWIMDRGRIISWSDDGKPLRMVGTHTDMSNHMR